MTQLEALALYFLYGCLIGLGSISINELVTVEIVSPEDIGRKQWVKRIAIVVLVTVILAITELYAVFLEAANNLY